MAVHSEHAAGHEASAIDPQGRVSNIVFWVVIVVGLGQLVVVWALDASYGTSDTTRLFAFSAGIAGAAVWWAALARYAEGEYRKLLILQLEQQREQSRRAQSALVNELQSELRTQRTVLMADQHARETPSEIYRELDGFDLRFTRDLTEDLERSRSYRFRGPTGVYVGARLQLREVKRGASLENVWVKVIDPRSPLAMRQAILDRRRKSVHANKPSQQIEDEIRDDVYMAIVALFDARTSAREIVIGHETRAVIQRTEMFDDAVYDARIAPESQNFPRTSRWSTRQPLYSRLLDEMIEEMQGLESVVFSRASPDVSLLDHLDRLELDRARVHEMRERYGTAYVAELGPAIESARSFSVTYRDPSEPELASAGDGMRR